MSSVRWANSGGAAIGVTIGCIIGMFPLLFIQPGMYVCMCVCMYSIGVTIGCIISMFFLLFVQPGMYVYECMYEYVYECMYECLCITDMFLLLFIQPGMYTCVYVCSVCLHVCMYT